MTGVTLPAEFESYSRNGEDVVLWRTLAHVDRGRYVEVGAHEPRSGSVSAAFYRHGWTGITVEPNPESAALHRQQRPGDIQIEAAAAATDGEVAVLHVIDDTGLSTLNDQYAGLRANSGFRTHDIEVPTRSVSTVLDQAGWAGCDINFMTVATEGSEIDVLRGTDLTRWRPWVLAVEAVSPVGEQSSRAEIEDHLQSAGYRFCLFDGLSCFFAAEERAEQLGDRLSIPAGALDNFTTPAYRRFRAQAEAVPALLDELARLRTQALEWWADAMNHAEDEDWQKRYAELADAHSTTLAELEGVYGSRSWRVTAPLRTALTAKGRTRNAR
jgi:FkbM family methyltransferase